MKKHAVLFKNIAAFIMLTALLTLLLPLGKVTTDAKSATVSGAQVLNIGMNIGYEYYSKGTIEEDYVLSNSMTWGDIKAGVTYVAENGKAKNVLIVSVIAALPIVFCFLAMCLTFMAQGKKTMFLATLIIAFAFFENIILIVSFLKLQQVLLPYMNVTLLIGMYAFTALSGIALGMISMLWVTGGFFEPKEKKKNRFSACDRRKGKRKRRRKKRKENKKKTKRNKKGKGEDYTIETVQEQPSNEKTDSNQDEKIESHRAGYIVGLSGMYKGINMELSKMTNGTFTIGTTPESVEAIQKGNMSNIDLIAKNSCIIEYSEANKQYKVSSYSVTEILLQMEGESQNVIRLQHGDSQIVSANTLLWIGNDDNSMRLE